MSFLRNFKYGFRMLAASPGLSLVAVLTLALGIGATTTIFTLVDGVLLRPLPYAEPERVVGFWGTGSWSRGETQFLRDNARAYDQVAAYDRYQLTLTGRQEPLTLAVVEASWNLFEVLGAQPALGRVFRPADEEPGRWQVAVLSDPLWRRSFAADPSVVGRTVTLGDLPFEVVGVMPPDFKFPGRETELWHPIEMDPESPGYSHSFYLALDRPPGAGHRSRRGPGRARAAGAAPPGGVRPARGLRQAGDAAGGDVVSSPGGRQPAAGAPGAVVGARLRAAHRLRQRCQPAAGPGLRAPTGDRGAAQSWGRAGRRSSASCWPRARCWPAWEAFSECSPPPGGSTW